MTLIAHRGYSSEAPENTIFAFNLAIKHGYKDIELDVQLTKDGTPIVIHDPTLDRTTNGSGLVSDHTYAQIRTLDAGSWYSSSYAGLKVPSLLEVLNQLRGVANLHIELKSDEIELVPKVIELLTSTGWAHDVRSRSNKFAVSNKTPLVISSFDRKQLLRSMSLAPSAVVHELLVEKVTDESLNWASKHKVRGYHTDGNDITPELVRKARQLNLEIGAWWWTRKEQDAHRIARHGARYAFVDSPSSHRMTVRKKLRRLITAK